MASLLFIWIWISGLSSLSPIPIHGLVHDAQSLTPISDVHIVLAPEMEIVTTNHLGEFHLVLSGTSQTILVSSVGYEPQLIPIDTSKKHLNIALKRQLFTMDEIVVQGQRSLQSGESAQNVSIANTDQFLEQLNGLSMIKRANFAWEPNLRGMNDARLAISLDGITMVGACVDRMDPVTSYVETENLEKVQVDKGNQRMKYGNQSGGSVTMVLSQPKMNLGWNGSLSATGQSNGGQQKFHGLLGYSNEKQAFQWSLLYRDSEDISAGDQQDIGLSGFRKINSKADFVHQLSENSKFVISHIADLAQDVGFPALIMDTRKALSHVFSAEYAATTLSPSFSRFSAKAYHTRIDHWMDDYDRDVSSRTLMPNMFMPMFGYTRTTGIRSEADFIHGNHLFSLNFDVHHFTAFADMLMESTLPKVSDMYLENLPKLGFGNGFISGNYTWMLSERISISGNAGFQTSLRTIQNDFGFDQLRGLHPDLERTTFLIAPSVSFGTEISLSANWSYAGTLSAGNRLPTHHEAYGYYVYNPLFDVFVFGNPSLRQERNFQINHTLAWQSQNQRLRFQMSGFWSEFRDYMGIQAQDQLFANYVNFERVSMGGGEAELRMNFGHGLSATQSFSYVWARNHDVDESLPMIPPAETRSIVEWKHGKWFLHGSARNVWRQSRIARSAVGESETPSFTVIDVRATVAIRSALNLSFGIENLTDKWYYEHTSPGQFPALGRNAYLKMEWKF